ncbi:MAG: ABC transporter ATP-binding protein [Candidatus Bipolaricaulaceae bacterium]
MNAALELTQVSFGFPQPRGILPVLENFSLSVPPKEWVSVVGPSGCGKTTLLRISAGLLQPQRGTVRVEGQPPRGRVAYMPQGETLLPWRTVLGNILAAREADGSHARASRKEALALLEAFDLAPFAQSFPHELSGGMRQRIAFLRAIFARRDLLLLDEPLGALDPLTRMEIQDWLGQIRHGLGKTVVLVTHDAEEAVLVADRVVVLTPRPARVAAEFSVGWAQPRARSSPAVQTARQAILDVLASTKSHGKEA